MKYISDMIKFAAFFLICYLILRFAYVFSYNLAYYGAIYTKAVIAAQANYFWCKNKRVLTSFRRAHWFASAGQPNAQKLNLIAFYPGATYFQPMIKGTHRMNLTKPPRSCQKCHGPQIDRDSRPYCGQCESIDREPTGLQVVGEKIVYVGKGQRAQEAVVVKPVGEVTKTVTDLDAMEAALSEGKLLAYVVNKQIEALDNMPFSTMKDARRVGLIQDALTKAIS